jgi:hypothetical protein
LSETDILHAIRYAVNKSGLARLWRNNVGVLHGVRFGLAVGSGDLIGLNKAGQFVSIEVKTDKGKPTKEQELWKRTVEQLGGIALVCRSPEEALEALR